MTEAKPWLRHYDEGVPHSLKPYPRETLLDALSRTARQKPDHTAFLFKGARLSYGRIDELSDALAAGLMNLGIRKGDRVALIMPNCPQIVIGQLGVWKAGAISVPVNPLYTEWELEHALTECGAETAIVLTPFYSKVKHLQPKTAVKRVIATNIKEYLPPVLRLLFTLAKEKKEGHRIRLQPGDAWLRDILRRHEGAGRPEVTVDPSDPALILFSGGTTGTPKGALGTHHGLLAAGMQINAWFKPVLSEWEDILVLLIPLFHVYGNVAVLATALVGHHPIAIVPNPRDLADVLATIRKVRPALLPAVPTLFIALLEHPHVKAGKVDFSCLKLSVAGAAPLLAETQERFTSLTGGEMVEGYGLTESMMGAVINPIKGEHKCGSIGIPLPDVEIRITDPETGLTDLPFGEVGEILMRAPQLMQGYWNRPEETANTIRDGWLCTGDLGYMDGDGYIFIVDRKKDVIKPGGFQVWPREVEEMIACHPAVAEVAVAGVPDDYQGEAVMAWVVVCEGQALTADELRNHCREKLVGYKIPKHIEFRSSLPKTTVGKVLRRELAREAAESMKKPQ